MSEVEGKVLSENGIELYFKKWNTANPEIKGTILLVHGMGEHCERYDHWALRFNKDGFNVIGFDHRGHGKSGGKRGHVPHFDDFIDEITIMIEKFVEYFPLYLYGHSLGGEIVTYYGFKGPKEVSGKKISALVLTSPYYGAAFVPPKWKVMMGKWLGGCWSSLTMATGLDPKGISRIAEECEKYENDGLVHSRLSAGLFKDMESTREYILTSKDSFRFPFLLCHGTGDKIAAHDKSKEFFERIDVEDKELKLFEDGFHELHNDLCADELYETISDWLSRRLKKDKKEKDVIEEEEITLEEKGEGEGEEIKKGEEDIKEEEEHEEIRSSGDETKPLQV